MHKIGLTGGIGSGKSTVSQIFKEKGVAVVDCDILAREIFFLYPEALLEIRKSFGEQFFDDTGNLKRRQLGDFVFREDSLKRKLEEITLPHIKKELFKRLEQYNISGERMCVVDAPTLIETGLHEKMDINILVWVDIETQFLRVKERDLISEEQIINRIRSQMPLEEKKKYVDFIIDNSRDFKYTEEQFARLWSKLNIWG